MMGIERCKEMLNVEEVLVRQNNYDANRVEGQLR